MVSSSHLIGQILKVWPGNEHRAYIDPVYEIIGSKKISMDQSPEILRGLKKEYEFSELFTQNKLTQEVIG